MTRESGGFLVMVWRRKWLLATCMLVSVAATSVVLAFYPARYHSQAVILVVPQRVPDEYVRAVRTDDIAKRVQSIQQQVLSRSRLEQIINEYGLYRDALEGTTMESLVDRMRRDVSVEMAGDNAFRIGFDGTDPRTVMRVAEKLASLFMDQNRVERSKLAAATNAFLESQLYDTRRRLTEQEAALADATRAGHATTKAATLEYEVAQQEYRDLLAKRSASQMATNLENRQIGEQFTVLEAARFPTQPIAANGAVARTGAAFAGFGLGIVVIGVTSRRRKANDDGQSDAH